MRIAMALDQLEDVVRAFDRHRSSARDQAGDLRGRSRAAQDAGGSGDVTREIENAVRILERQADELDRMRRDLRSRIERARSLLEAPSLSFSAVITGIASALRGMFGSGSRGEVLGTRTGPLPRTDPRQVPAPQYSQLGSAYLDIKHTTPDYSQGGGNCGPTSLAMVIAYYVAQGLTPGGKKAITPLDAASRVRGGAEFNRVGYNGYTNFGLNLAEPTGRTSRSLLADYRLDLVPVTGVPELTSHVTSQHPVVVLVNNNVYRYLDPPPYGAAAGDGFFTKDHIVVVTGVINGKVYVNDPLRAAGADPLVLDLDLFVRAAESTDIKGWYAAAVIPGMPQPDLPATPVAAVTPQPDLTATPIAGGSASLRPEGR